jgi:hypothetical protein
VIHPSKLPTKKAPNEQWIYALCLGGPLDGLYKDIPANIEFGKIVRWEEGCYMIGVLLPDARVRVCAWAR